MQEIYCTIGSKDSGEKVMIHRLVRIPLADWRALADWCWEEERREQFRRLVSLGTGDPSTALDAVAVRQLEAEVLAQPTEPRPQAVTSALDALVPFLEEAIQIVEHYAGKPYTVTVGFHRGPARTGSQRNRGGG
jgi:hypothetical protein